MTIISLSSIFIKTPISIGVLLFLQTSLTTLFISRNINSSWTAIIIFIIFIGGLLILFIYMRRIACNEKFKLNLKFLIFILILIIPTEELIGEFQLNEMENKYVVNESIVFRKIYNKKSNLITIIIFIYIFLTIVVVTKIVKIYCGPLRSFS